MRIILAIICFIATIIHGFFGYYVYLKGETIFQPEGMVVAVAKKQPAGLAAYDVFKLSSGHITDKKLEEQAKNVDNTAAPVEPAVEAAQPSILDSLKPAEDKPLVKENEVREQADGQFAVAEEKAEPEYLNFSTGWVGMLLVENAMIGLITLLLGIGTCSVCGKGRASRWVFTVNFIFWGALTGFIWLFRPVNTPLEMMRIGMSFPQWYFIIAITGAGAVISLLAYFMSFGKPKNAVACKSVEPVKPEPVKSEAAPKAEEKPAKKSLVSRFSLGKKSEGDNKPKEDKQPTQAEKELESFMKH